MVFDTIQETIVRGFSKTIAIDIQTINEK